MENRGKEFDLILQECLDALLSGRATLDSLLAQHSEIAEELRPHLEAAQWLSQRRTALDLRPGYLQASRNRIVERIRQESAHAPQPARRQPGWLEGVFQAVFGRVKLAQGLTALMLVACLLAASGGSLAWAAHTSLPGDRLYSMKIAYETARLALTFSDYGEARLRLEFAENRVKEIYSLVNHGDYEPVAATIDEYTRQMDAGLQSLEKVTGKKDSRGQKLADQFSRGLASQHLLLSAAARTSQTSAAADLQRAIQASERGLLSVQSVMERIKNDKKAETAASGTASVTPSPTATATTTLVLSPTASGTIIATPSGTPGPTLEGSTEDESKKPKPTKKPSHTPKPTHTPKPDKPDKPTKTPKP